MKKFVYLLPLVCLVSVVSSCSSSESSSLDINKVNLNIINNENLGTVIYDEKDYFIGDVFSFTINEKTYDNKVSYVTINNINYITNSENYFSFEIRSDVNITINYHQETSDEFVDVNFEDNEQIDMSSEQLILSNKAYINDFIKIDYSLSNNYRLANFVLNDDYIISTNSKGEYEFKAMFALNNIKAVILNDGDIDDDVYLDFVNYVGEKEISDIDFSSQNVFKPIDVANISFLMLKNNPSFYVYSFNKAVSKALFITNTQNTNSIFIKNDNGIFKENIAVGDNLKMAERFLNYNENNIDHYQVSGSNVIDYNHATYDTNSVATYNNDSYKQHFGVRIDDIFHYKLDRQYELDGEVIIDNIEFKNSIVKNNNQYEISLNLNPLSAVGYSTYMTTTTNFEGAPSISYQKEVPTFKDIGIKLILDLNLRPLKFITRETYVVHALMDVDTDSYSKSVFYYEHKDAPSINESISYDSIYNDINL